MSLGYRAHPEFQKRGFAAPQEFCCFIRLSLGEKSGINSEEPPFENQEASDKIADVEESPIPVLGIPPPDLRAEITRADRNRRGVMVSMLAVS